MALYRSPEYHSTQGEYDFIRPKREYEQPYGLGADRKFFKCSSLSVIFGNSPYRTVPVFSSVSQARRPEIQ